MNDADTTMSAYEHHRQARARLSESNKAAVFAALAAASITRVLVEFDGEGDSGQIYSVTAFSGADKVDVPKAIVSIQTLSWGTPEPVTDETQLAEAIETLCYDYLEETHGGWENNDGAFGEFHFDAAEGTIDLEFYGRFTDTHTSYHTF